MNEDILQSQWKEVRAQARHWWGALTEADLDKINGRRDKLIGKLQEKYGFSKEQATYEVDDRLAEMRHPASMGR